MKLIILDRDGVINEDSDAYIKSPAEWRPIPGSLEAIVKLKHAGFRVVVASNQSGLARGLFDYDTLFAIHDKMARMLADIGTQLDGIFFCPHGPDDDCGCRKPKTGMLDDIARRFGRSIRGTPFIGDSATDIQTAQAFGARPVFVQSGARAQPRVAQTVPDTDIHADLAEAVDALLAEQGKKPAQGKKG